VYQKTYSQSILQGSVYRVLLSRDDCSHKKVYFFNVNTNTKKQ